MTWLVTGGAGYIGAHVVRAFQAESIPVAVIDDLSSGHASFVPDGVPFVRGSLLDAAARDTALGDHDVRGVVHLAGFKYAGKSVEVPLHTYEQNVEGTRLLLESMGEHGVDLLVFSSSAAVYGTPDVDMVTESTPLSPESPYGESKLIGEWLIRDVAQVTALRHTSLRYFNVVGSGLRRPVRHEPAQPVPARAQGAHRRGDAKHQRQRLPDPGRHLRARLPPRGATWRART